jgi:hypothetical protein
VLCGAGCAQLAREVQLGLRRGLRDVLAVHGALRAVRRHARRLGRQVVEAPRQRRQVRLPPVAVERRGERQVVRDVPAPSRPGGALRATARVAAARGR